MDVSQFRRRIREGVCLSMPAEVVADRVEAVGIQHFQTVVDHEFFHLFPGHLPEHGPDVARGEHDDPAHAGNFDRRVEDRVAAHAVPDQKDRVGIDAVFRPESRSSHMTDQAGGILNAMGNGILALTSPRAAMMGDQHHAPGAAERLPDVVEAPEPGEAVKHQHAGTLFPECPVRDQDLSVDLRVAAPENQRVIIGDRVG